jgi:hypothetical protein
MDHVVLIPGDVGLSEAVRRATQILMRRVGRSMYKVHATPYASQDYQRREMGDFRDLAGHMYHLFS